MISAGNDIIALNAINKQRTLEPRFYSKILSPAEQALYCRALHAILPFEIYVWLLWSVKESVFKFLKRDDPGLIFSPVSIVIQNLNGSPDVVNDLEKWEFDHGNDDLFNGEVIYNSNRLYFKTKLDTQWLATAVNDSPDFEDFCWAVHKISDQGYQQQSLAVRAYFIEKYSSFYGNPIAIKKSTVGYPLITQNGELLVNPVSFAHDGLYVSYCYKILAETLHS